MGIVQYGLQLAWLTAVLDLLWYVELRKDVLVKRIICCNTPDGQVLPSHAQLGALRAVGVRSAR